VPVKIQLSILLIGSHILLKMSSSISSNQELEGSYLGEQRQRRESCWRSKWEENKGMVLILCSEVFGSSMAAVARLLQIDHNGMTTLQVGKL
jgi:hypothetical protein